MAYGVGQQVVHDLHEQHLVAAHLGGVELGALDAHPGAGAADPGDLPHDDLVHVDDVGHGGGDAVVQPGEGQQRRDQLLHPLLLQQHVGRELPSVGPVRIALSHLGHLAHRGERRPELVGGIGDELPLQPLCRVDPVEHLVQRARQPGELVSRPRRTAAGGAGARR